MREIKFRGKSKYSDKIIFGDLNHSSDGESIFIDDEVVYPESVAQLVGYDADGNEIYEGDTVIYWNDEDVKIRFSAETDTCSYLGIAGDKFFDCKLKK